MSLSRFISPNTTLWQSILRVAKDSLIASNADSIPVNPYSLYSSIDITNSKDIINEDIINEDNITEDIYEDDIKNTDKFYKKGKMSFWCDN